MGAAVLDGHEDFSIPQSFFDRFSDRLKEVPEYQKFLTGVVVLELLKLEFADWANITYSELMARLTLIENKLQRHFVTKLL